MSAGEGEGWDLPERPADLLGDVWFLALFKDGGISLPSLVLAPFPSPRAHFFLSMFPQMMIMMGAICAIIVVVIVSKYR